MGNFPEVRFQHTARREMLSWRPWDRLLLNVSQQPVRKNEGCNNYPNNCFSGSYFVTFRMRTLRVHALVLFDAGVHDAHVTHLQKQTRVNLTNGMFNVFSVARMNKVHGMPPIESFVWRDAPLNDLHACRVLQSCIVQEQKIYYQEVVAVFFSHETPDQYPELPVFSIGPKEICWSIRAGLAGLSVVDYSGMYNDLTALTRAKL